MAKLPPFEDVSLSIDVKTNQTPPQALTFHFKYGVLSVTNTDPPVVQVFLDGKPMGASPTNVVLAPGKYSVALWAAGYDTNTDSVEVADKTTTPPRKYCKTRRSDWASPRRGGTSATSWFDV